MRWSAGLVLFLGCAIPMWAQERGNPQTTVAVYDGIEASWPLLEIAEREADRIFGEAGIDLRWVNCWPGGMVPDCAGRTGAGQISLRVVARPLSLSAKAMGVAFVAKGEGSYADVFFDHLEKLYSEDASLNLGPILGHVMAHEIGHLLLGSNSH